MIKPTEEQENAINMDGLCVLSACPGSGKTFTIAHRIKRIIDRGLLLPYQGIAALSFTNVAKDSIVREYEEISGKRMGFPHFVGTIDSFLNNMVFTPFAHTVIGNGEKPVKILSVHSEWLNVLYPKAAQYGIVPQDITFNIKGEIVCQGNKLADIKQQQYIERLKADLLKKNVVTQGDVNYFCHLILKQHAELRRALKDRYPYIIVDEAQDCSAVQMGVVDLLCEAGHSEIMLVGDAYQAIYEWRDADPLLLIKKEKDTRWLKKELLFSQRSGEAICRFLNRFHKERTIKQEPLRTELNDAEVKIVGMKDCETLCESFLLEAKRKGIAIEKDRVAILYGGHRSQINFKKLNGDPVRLWKDSDGGIANARKVYSLPLLSKLALMQRDYKKSYDHVESLYYFLMENQHKRSSDDIKEHALAEIKSRIILWEICKSLPSLDMSIDDWIIKVNALVADGVRRLGVKGLLEIKKTRGLKNINLQQELLGNASSIKFINDITLDNIHQIKGRTFDAVLVFIDSGKGAYKLSISKMKRLLEHQDLIAGEHHEDGRCFYVAASRARRLLWVASKDVKIQDVFK